MRKFFLSILLTLGMAPMVYADGINTTVSSTTVNPRWTVTVFNDSGGNIVSGDVVVWDNDDTEFDRSGYPYVTTTTTADDDWVAGVVAPGLICPDQQLCEIVVYGPVLTKIAGQSDDVTEDTTVSAAAVAGMAGDWDGGANECYLGLAMEDRDHYSGLDLNRDGEVQWVFVNIGCED